MSWVTRTTARWKGNRKNEEGNVKLERNYKFCCHVITSITDLIQDRRALPVSYNPVFYSLVHECSQNKIKLPCGCGLCLEISIKICICIYVFRNMNKLVKKQAVSAYSLHQYSLSAAILTSLV